MPEVVALQSGPQGRANDSWDILQHPSPPELGAQPAEVAKEAESDLPSTEEPKPPAKAEEVQEAGEPIDGQKDKQQQERRESRYERTKRQRKAFEAQRESFEAERKQFAEQRRAFEEQARRAQEPPYTLKELKTYRKTWEKEGNFDLVEKADAEIQRLEELEASQKHTLELPTSGSPEFVRQWQSAEQELYSADAEFQREGTRLDKVLRTMMSGPDGNLYRQHPRGIVAAYHRARLAIAENDLGVVRSENQKLKQELSRLNGLLGIGGGASGGRAIGEFGGKDFANMSTKEMREHLKRNAAR